MFSRLGCIYGGVARGRQLMKFTNGVSEQSVTSVRRHSESAPQPFSNMPFKIKSRFAATLFFAVFFGVGLWAPLIIVWYSMAKKTM